MAIDPEEVARVAHLARLNLGPGEAARYAEELGAILDLVAQMDTVDASGVEPMGHPLDAVQRLRPDEVTEEVDRDAYQAMSRAHNPYGDGKTSARIAGTIARRR